MLEIPASHRDLLESEFATLGTPGPDGLPQLTEEWSATCASTTGLASNGSW
jgi:hypothetical protein